MTGNLDLPFFSVVTLASQVLFPRSPRSAPYLFFFFFNDTATTEIYTLSLHDALPICPTRPTPVTSATLPRRSGGTGDDLVDRRCAALRECDPPVPAHDVHGALNPLAIVFERVVGARDRKSTCLNSSHM